MKAKNLSDTKGRLAIIPQEASSAFGEHVESLVAIAEAGGASVVLSSFATPIYPTNLR